MNIRPARIVASHTPFLVLTRHFFNRLFQNDVFPFEDQLKERLFALLAILTSGGGLLAKLIFGKYMMAVADHGASYQEKCFFLTFFMLLLAFFVVLEWDVIFLDKRDLANLNPLPIRPGTIFGAKLGSLLAFVGLYTAAVNALAIIVVAIFLAQWKAVTIGAMVVYASAHLVAATAANLTAFFLIVLVQAVLLVTLGPRLLRPISLVLRFALLLALISSLLILLFDAAYRGEVVSRLVQIKAAHPGTAIFIPPLWFTSLYEALLGSRDPAQLRLAAVGLGALPVLMGLYVLAMTAGYRRHFGRTSDLAAEPRHRGALVSRVSACFDGLFLRNPVERAVFHFFARTLWRSPAHRIRLAGYLAVGVGVSLIPIVFRSGAPPGPPVVDRSLLAVPLIISFFVLLGLRSLVGVPFFRESNWIFRMTESEVHRPYFTGMKKAVTGLTLFPVLGMLFPVYAALWGPGPALLHFGFGLACSLLLLEAIFLRYSKIPFACSPAPGKSNLHVLWMAYVSGFLLYVVGLDKLEKVLFRRPSAFVFFFATVGILVGVLEQVQGRTFYLTSQIVYEEEREPALVTLEYHR